MSVAHFQDELAIEMPDGSNWYAQAIEAEEL